FVGRYFTNPLAFIIQGELARRTGVFQLHKVYPAISLSLLLLFVMSAWIFARQWGYHRGVVASMNLFWGSLGFVVLFLHHMPNLASSFYQISQLLMHQLCNALALLLLAVLLHHFQLPEGWKKNTLAALAMALTVAVMGASEIIMFWNGTLIFALMMTATRTRHPGVRFYQILFALAVLGAMAGLFAPGTLARIGETASPSVSFWLSAAESLSWSLRYMVSWSLSPTLWVLTLLLFPHAIKVVKVHPWLGRFGIMHLLVFAILWAGMIWASWFLLAGIGREMPSRVINGIYFYYLLGWFIGVHLAIAAFRIHSLPLGLSNRSFIRLLPVMLCVSFLMPGPGLLRPHNNFVQVVVDLSGPLWTYRQQQLQRLDRIGKTLDAGKPFAEVSPFKEKPISIFYEDILPDRSNNWRNRFMGAFYGLESVHLVSEDNGSAAIYSSENRNPRE
ncbi:MAG TPA: hypothetical protein HPQ00_05000, partial [Magnetococcales bacterium]|nr:hypothetical protein [Magnetococcales bacterium]